MKARPILFSGPMVRALLDGRKTQTRRIVAPGNTRLFDPERGSYRPVQELLDIAFEEAADFRSLDGIQVWTAKARDYQMCDRTNWQGSSEYGVVGDRLWVRESGLEHKTTRLFTHDATPGRWWTPEDGGRYGAGYSEAITRKSLLRTHRVRPSIHMPRWASRLTLQVTGVRIERLQTISEADAVAEGVPFGEEFHPIAETSNEDEGRAYCPTCRGWGVHSALGANLGVTEVDCADCDTARKLYRNLWTHINGPTSWADNPFVWVVEFEVHQANVDAFIEARAA